MPEIKLIIEFRDWINSNDWTLFEYANKGNKNNWNCICSAMDWIDVSIQYINTHPLNAVRGKKSIELFSYISCVDVVVEAIEQLHRVIYSTSKRVFEEDCDCFIDNPFGQTDREYFKTIRACFGAHPVNLNDPEDPNNRDAKRFASWSGDFFGPADFSVFLYSNKVDGEDIILGIKYSQVETFLKKYYHYLPVLKDKLQRQFDMFREKKKKEVILHFDDPIKQLTVLQKECTERLNNGYYKETIDELLRTFQTPITCENNRGLVNRYLDALKEIVKEIYHNLQSMNLCDLSIDTISYNSLPLQRGWGYWVSKLSEARFGRGYAGLFWVDQIQRIFGEYFVFEYESWQELYVLVEATIFDLSSTTH